MKTIVLASFFDSLNLGDRLIAAQMLTLAGQHGEVKPVSYGGRRFQTDPALCGAGSAPEVPLTRSVARDLLLRVSDGIGLRATLSGLRRRLSTDHRPLKQLIRDSDLLVVAGGNLLYDLDSDSRSDLELRYFAELANRYETPLVVMAVGIGPFSTGIQAERACRELGRARYVTFRDDASLRLYGRFRDSSNAALSLDPVLALSELTPRAELTSPQTIGVNLVGPSMSPSKLKKVDYVRFVERVLAEFEAFNVRLFSTDQRDYAFLERVARDVGSDRCAIELIGKKEDCLKFLQSCSLVIASRMHSLILAYTQLVPVVGIVWQPKVAEFMSMMGDSQNAYPLLTLHDDLSAVTNSINEQLEDPAARSRVMACRLATVRSRLSIDDELFASVLAEL